MSPSGSGGAANRGSKTSHYLLGTVPGALEVSEEGEPAWVARVAGGGGGRDSAGALGTETHLALCALWIPEGLVGFLKLSVPCPRSLSGSLMWV